ncbi:unnamed protein product [Bursaphelenchus okinawaensis]|uniref:Uncharacterized protein n=1 Tax=Bursaphelenchus okinawaensis TaxID=465554 RepID=A0A811KPR8_9BILA|nr:unnamed protein product [Bursaphelenchus okinawaensis]CAG9109547.1 unnamed protein product [Bursaphelenchus okinawaensis]
MIKLTLYEYEFYGIEQRAINLEELAEQDEKARTYCHDKSVCYDCVTSVIDGFRANINQKWYVKLRCAPHCPDQKINPDVASHITHMDD